MRQPSVVTADLVRPPAEARSQLPWLRGLRTFDLCFDESAYARKLTAYNASDRKLDQSGGAIFNGQTR
jgi:hypothetical protein